MGNDLVSDPTGVTAYSGRIEHDAAMEASEFRWLFRGEFLSRGLGWLFWGLGLQLQLLFGNLGPNE